MLPSSRETMGVVKFGLLRRILSTSLGGRMDYDQILPQLFVGSRPRVVADIEELVRRAEITSVLNLQTNEDMAWYDTDWSKLEAHYQKTGISVMRFPVRDFDPEDLRDKLPGCVRALEQLLEAGHTVYLHCTAGVNRSPTVAAAYLHRCRGWDLERAIAFVKERRACSPEVDAIRLAVWDGAEGFPQDPD
jgi:protein-tyrosine phosphatase